MTTIAIIDYGMGNLRSVAKAFAHVAPEQQVIITQSPQEIDAADRVVLPGQAAMPESMAALSASGLKPAIERAFREKPFLGVCLGMQMLLSHSEEGDCPGLGFYPGTVRRFPHPHRGANGEILKVPHMGWNVVRRTRHHPCWAGVAEGSAFYFAHSYYAVADDPSLIVGEADYPWPFAVALARGNVFAVQFHPEKSAAAGLQVLANFARWDGRL